LKLVGWCKPLRYLAPGSLNGGVDGVGTSTYTPKPRDPDDGLQGARTVMRARRVVPPYEAVCRWPVLPIGVTVGWALALRGPESRLRYTTAVP
jgi:hypothetical protein